MRNDNFRRERFETVPYGIAWSSSDRITTSDYDGGVQVFADHPIVGQNNNKRADDPEISGTIGSYFKSTIFFIGLSAEFSL